jgi:hypothetical protein
MLGRAVVALLAVVLLATPVRADEERVLVDLVARLRPDDDDGHCLQLDAGSVAVTVQLVGSPVLPVRFLLGIAKDADAERIRTTVGSDPTRYSVPVEAGIYCYSLHDESAPHERPIPPEDLGTSSQLVALRIVWSPQVASRSASGLASVTGDPR